MNSYKLTIKLLVFLLAATPLIAQEDDGILTFDKIYSKEFKVQYPSSVNWFDEGNAYIQLQDEAKGQNIVMYTPEGEVPKMLVKAKELIPDGKDDPIDIHDYSFSQDKSKVLIYTNSKKVWRYYTKGDYWLYNRTTGKLNQLGRGFKESCMMHAEFSPDGTKVAYVYENNIYIEDLNSLKRSQLTIDGTETIINGTFDWVYEEEFFLHRGFRWSPDSKNIAYWQLDASKVKVFHMINNTDSLYPSIKSFRYSKPGQELSSAKVGVISVEGGNTNWIKIEGDPANNYIPYMEWASGNDELMIQQINRRQNTNHVYLANIKNGKVKEILTETDDAWLEYIGNIYWLENGKYFIWQSERTGWRHLYKVSRDGKKIEAITKGEYDIYSSVKVDEKRNVIYFVASPDNTTQRYLYSAPLDKYSKYKLVSPANQKGYYRYNISPDGNYAVQSFSTFGVPFRYEMVSLPSHKVVKVLESNEKLKNKVAALKKSPVEFFQVELEGNVIDGYMMKPYNFDETKKYPVLFFVYGEPWDQMVWDAWDKYYYYLGLLLSQKGYIIISFDTRGTRSAKGCEFRKACYLKIGEQNSSDHAKVTREIIKWPFIDPDRIAIYGHSGGGTSTLNALFRYPDLYQTGMSAAPVPNLRLYNAIYQERYMRTPQEEPEKYKNLSAITHAKNLKGNLLIIHGTGDDNVHYQGTEMLINELIKHNKPFDMMAYPNRSHSIKEGKNTDRHFHELLTRYLMDHVEPGGK